MPMNPTNRFNNAMLRKVTFHIKDNDMFMIHMITIPFKFFLAQIEILTTRKELKYNQHGLTNILLYLNSCYI